MEWTVSIEVDRPVEEVRDAVVDQHRLMAWSAWQEATGYSCRVDGDGRTPGSAIVFVDSKGVERGRQTLTAVGDRLVENGSSTAAQVAARCALRWTSDSAR